MDMERSQCRCCGASLDPRKAENGVLRCDYCGAIWTIARKEGNPAAISFLRMGEHDLDVCRFDDAYTAFAKAAELDPKEPEAYFGMALATFRVQYLKDLLQEKPRMQPICHEISQKKFTADGNYQRAIVLATAAQRAEYERKGREIDYIRQEFYKLSESQLDYDCFLCVKVTNEQSGQTGDCVRANEIYFHLKEKGYKPFFSEREIGSRTGADYEAMILYALYRSECMLVVCSDESYLQTKWVKNEYTRFLALINDEAKERDAITFVFAGKPIENLPGKKGIQGIDYTKPDAYLRIVDYVERHTPEAKRRRDEELRRKKREEEERWKREQERDAQIQQLQRQLAEATKQGQGMGGFSDKELFERMERARLEREKAEREARERVEREAREREDFEIEGTVLKKYTGEGGNVVIPNGVISIGKEAFRICTGLTSITIPASVTSIGEKAFTCCMGLTSIVVSSGNSKYHSDGNCLIETASKTLVLGCKNSVIPSDGSVTSIGDYAFSYCKGLTSITIPDSVTSIGSEAFSYCKELTSIIFPNGVESIGRGAFSACDGLTKVVIPDGMKSIGRGAFCYCTGLRSIAIPDSVTSIGKYAFSGCKKLTIYCKTSRWKKPKGWIRGWKGKRPVKWHYKGWAKKP